MISLSCLVHHIRRQCRASAYFSTNKIETARSWTINKHQNCFRVHIHISCHSILHQSLFLAAKLFISLEELSNNWNIRYAILTSMNSIKFNLKSSNVSHVNCSLRCKYKCKICCCAQVYIYPFPVYHIEFPRKPESKCIFSTKLHCVHRNDNKNT